MKLPKPDRYSVINLGLGAVGGGGLAAEFKVLHGASGWIIITVTFLTIRVLAILGGWVTPRLWNAVLFPIGLLVCFTLITDIGELLPMDIGPITLVVNFGIVYGGSGFVAFCAGWMARWYVLRLQGSKGSRG